MSSFFFSKGVIYLRGNKKRAISETAVKTIINMDIAATVLDGNDMRDLYRIINKLKESDQKGDK